MNNLAMSWASVVKRQRLHSTPRLAVAYAADSDSKETSEDDGDGIPRYKEISPHPACWYDEYDYIMTNGKYDDDIKSDEDDEDFSLRVCRERNNIHIDFDLLVFGYFRARKGLGLIPDEIKEMVRLYSCNISPVSMEKIAATHLITRIIDEYMNDINNKCQYITNCDDELNILQYIYIKGGACRDCILSRDIKDVDIVINIHELSQKYYQHLIKYHSKIEHQDKNCKCIFWRHYMNKFKVNEMNNYDFDDDEYNLCDIDDENVALYGEIDDEDVIKILKFESLITNCDYLLNGKFICDIICKSDKILSHQKVITCKFFGYSHHILLQSAINHNGLIINNVEFDICDNFIWHSYGAVQPLKLYKKLVGDKETNNGLLKINKYYQNDKNNKNIISIPLYPFPAISALIYYDFTINCIHIDLYTVLINNSPYNQYNIDFYWDNKVIYKKYNNDTFNKYNNIAVNDIKNKLLIAPNLNVITKWSANYFFWRLVKTAAKFIYKIMDKKNKWKIDEKYLLQSIKHYNLWFDDEFIESRHLSTKFINKFFKWNISKPQDFIDRFHVFRYIKFEKYFILKIKQYPIRIKNNMRNNMYPLPYQQRKVLIKCFKDFGYPQIWNSYGY